MQKYRDAGGSIQRKSPISLCTVLCSSLSPKTAHAHKHEIKAHSLSSFLKALIPFQLFTHILPLFLHFLSLPMISPIYLFLFSFDSKSLHSSLSYLLYFL